MPFAGISASRVSTPLKSIWSFCSVSLAITPPTTTTATAQRFRVPALLVCRRMRYYFPASWQGVFPAPPHIYGQRVVTLGIPAFLSGCLVQPAERGRLGLKFAPLVLIGDASYILYLIHPYCEYSLDRFLGRRHPWLNQESATGALIGVTLSIAIALVLHLYAERPLVKFLNRHFGGKRKSARFAPARNS